MAFDGLLVKSVACVYVVVAIPREAIGPARTHGAEGIAPYEFKHEGVSGAASRAARSAIAAATVAAASCTPMGA